VARFLQEKEKVGASAGRGEKGSSALEREGKRINAPFLMIRRPLSELVRKERRGGQRNAHLSKGRKKRGNCSPPEMADKGTNGPIRICEKRRKKEGRTAAQRGGQRCAKNKRESYETQFALRRKEKGREPFNDRSYWRGNDGGGF